MLTNEKAWLDGEVPADVVTALGRWTDISSMEVEHRRWLSGGSSSYVAVTHVVTRRMSRNQVLKLLPPDLGGQETTSINKARQYSPLKFLEEHVVRTDPPVLLPDSGWWVQLQDVAGGDTDRWQPFRQIIDESDFSAHLAAVVKSLQIDWNSEEPTRRQHKNVGDYLRDELAPYLGENRGLSDYVQLSGLSRHADTHRCGLREDEKALPNPLALLESRESIEFWTGNGHGDLHLENLVVKVFPSVDTKMYQLLDLGRFSNEMPVARDPMKMLVAVAAEWLRDLVPRTPLRRQLAELIVDPISASPTPRTAGYREVSLKVHEACEATAEELQAGHDWPHQKLIALAVVALRFAFQSRFNIEDRHWFFMVASLATHEFRRQSPVTMSSRPEALDTARELRRPHPDGPTGGGTGGFLDAKVYQLPVRPRPRATSALVEKLSLDLEELAASATDARLSLVAGRMNNTAQLLGFELANANNTSPARRRLRAVSDMLSRLTDLPTARRVLPELKEALDELRYYVDRRPTSTGD